jgi:formamidopyrimidine-DNA glycosylase
MPELPEVEAAATVARAAARGHVITSVEVRHPAQRRILPARAARSLAGDGVRAVLRRGKYQLFRLTSGRLLQVHFRMTGDWQVVTRADPLPAHARVVITFDSGRRLVLADPRALSAVSLHPAGSDPLPDLGPEADDPRLDAERLRRALARRRGTIKNALLDQRVVAGLGNIYVAEVLWRARIDPRVPAQDISRARVARLVLAMRRVIERARPLAVRYYRQAATRSATARFAVYDREGQRCRRCAGRIRRITQGSRSTYFCPRCQR